MSSFEELQVAYDSFKKNRQAYLDECYKFAATFRRGFISYSQCPDESVHWFPPSKGFDPDAKPRTMYTQAGAMEMAEDGFWRLGFSVLLTPKRAVLHYILNFKKVGEKFVLKLENMPKEFDVRESNQEEMKHFFEHMINLALNYYKYGIRDFVEQTGRRSIGFMAVMREDLVPKPSTAADL